MSFWSHLFDDDPFLFQQGRHLAAAEAKAAELFRTESGETAAASAGFREAPGAGPPGIAEPAAPALIEAAPPAFISDHFALTLSPEGDLVPPGPDLLASMPMFGPTLLFHDGGDVLFG